MQNVTACLNFKHRRIMVTILAICLTSLLLGACATTYDKMDKLNQTLRGYEKALRWAKFDMAHSFRKFDAGKETSPPAHLKNIRITVYDVTRQHFDEKTMTAELTVSISYYNVENLREHSLQDKQSWKFFPEQKRWYLMSELPGFN